MAKPAMTHVEEDILFNLLAIQPNPDDETPAQPTGSFSCSEAGFFIMLCPSVDPGRLALLTEAGGGESRKNCLTILTTSSPSSRTVLKFA